VNVPNLCFRDEWFAWVRDREVLKAGERVDEMHQGKVRGEAADGLIIEKWQPGLQLLAKESRTLARPIPSTAIPEFDVRVGRGNCEADRRPGLSEDLEKLSRRAPLVLWLKFATLWEKATRPIR
jgi:hypothetical protein